MSRTKEQAVIVTGQTGVAVAETPLVEGAAWQPSGSKFALGYHRLTVADIQPSPTNPRKRIDLDHLVELAKSITEHGVIQPIVVRMMFSPGGALDHYQLVAGERRWRAAQLAGLTTIPAIVQDLNDDQVLEVQVIENAQREDIHPLEECDGFNLILARGIYDVAGLAEKLGKSVDYVRGRTNMARLIPEAREEFASGFIGIGHVRVLVAMPAELQKDAVKYLTLDWNKERLAEAPNPKSLRTWMDRSGSQPLIETGWDLTDASLVPKAGACSTCEKRTGPGTLFPDDEEKCLDHRCFATKREALIKLRMAESGASRYLVNYGTGKGDDHVRRYDVSSATTEPGDGKVPLVVKEPVRLDYNQPFLPPGTVVYVPASDLEPKEDRDAERKAEREKRTEVHAADARYRTALATAICNLVDYSLPPTADFIVADLARVLNKDTRNFVSAVTGLAAKPKTNEDLVALYHDSASDLQLRIFTALTLRSIVLIDEWMYFRDESDTAKSLARLEEIARNVGANLREVRLATEPAPQPKKEKKPKS